MDSSAVEALLLTVGNIDVWYVYSRMVVRLNNKNTPVCKLLSA
jgi:hypothetical protein